MNKESRGGFQRDERVMWLRLDDKKRTCTAQFEGKTQEVLENARIEKKRARE